MKELEPISEHSGIGSGSYASSEFVRHSSQRAQGRNQKMMQRVLEEEHIPNEQINIAQVDSLHVEPKKEEEKQEFSGEIKKKGIFEEYQLRWSQNNKKIFRYLITWQVGDNGKMEDQLKLMITYLSIIFVTILLICGFATVYYFHQTNKENIKYSVQKQAQTLLKVDLEEYNKSTEYIFDGYEFVLNYLNDIILSKLEISYKIYNFNEIRQFPYKGPNRMHEGTSPDKSQCQQYKGVREREFEGRKGFDIRFDASDVSMKCIDWCVFNATTQPMNHVDVYQKPISLEKLNAGVDVLNYILESELFEVFVTKICKIYFSFETRQHSFIYPGLLFSSVPKGFDVHSRPWYSNTRDFHLNQSNNSTYRVISTPYYDALSKSRVVTISKAILAPSPLDPTKRYLEGKGQFMGVASIDIYLNEFQKIFDDVLLYDTGYLAIVDGSGKLLNEPKQFISQINKTGQVFEDLSITELIDINVWTLILATKTDLIQQTYTNQGLSVIVASKVNEKNLYKGQSIVTMFVIPQKEVEGIVDIQNRENFNRILLSSLVTLGAFLIATLFCTLYVQRKLTSMVSAITQLNQSAIKLSEHNHINEQNGLSSTTSSKKEVMQKLNEIHDNAKSKTIQQLVKGFENQLKGISKLGKGGQNKLKNCKNSLKYEKAPYCGTQLMTYIEPLLDYIETKKDKNPKYSTANQAHNLPFTLSSSRKSIGSLSKKQEKNLLSSRDSIISSSRKPLVSSQIFNLQSEPLSSSSHQLIS